MTLPEPSRIRNYTRTLMAQHHRQVLVVEGASPRHAAERAGQWLGTALTVRFQKDRGAVHVVYVSDRPSTPFQKCRASLRRHIPPPLRNRVFVHPVVWSRVWTRMGTTNQAVVVDLTSLEGGWRPNRLAMIADTVEGGGWLVLLIPPRDSLSLPPYEQRLLQLTRQRAVWWSLNDGSLHLPDLPDPVPWPLPEPSGHLVESLARTRDQQEAFRQLIRWWSRKEPRHLLLHAHRGRGKSFLLGMFLGWLARQPYPQTVSVVVPSRTAARSLFQGLFRTCRLLNIPTRRPQARMEVGSLQLYVGTPDTPPPFQVPLLVVDEAAQRPYDHLLRWARQAERALLSTTLHGYEGTGRTFPRRLHRDLEPANCSLNTPIRYAPGDPLEHWLNEVLLRDATPEPLPEQLPASLHLRELDRTHDLREASTLRAWVGLYREAHYRFEPDDVHRMLNAPHIRLWEARTNGVRVGILEGARETPPEGLIPDVIRRYLDPSFSTPGYRVVRIAVHPELQRRGRGRAMLAQWRASMAREGVAWVGTAFGLDPDLMAFWANSGFHLIWIGPGPHPATGRFTGIWLSPLKHPDPETLRTWGLRTRERLIRLLETTYWDMDTRLVHSLLALLPTPPHPLPFAPSEDQRLRIERFRAKDLAWPMVRDLTRMLGRQVLWQGWMAEEPDREVCTRVVVDHWIRNVPLRDIFPPDQIREWTYRSHRLWNRWLERWERESAVL